MRELRLSPMALSLLGQMEIVVTNRLVTYGYGLYDDR